MTSGESIRQVLRSPRSPRCLSGGPTRRSKTASETILCGVGERSVPPRRQLSARGDGKANCDKNMVSSIPIRDLPLYNSNGTLLQTGRTENHVGSRLLEHKRAMTPYSQRRREDTVKDLLSPPLAEPTACEPVTPETMASSFASSRLLASPREVREAPATPRQNTPAGRGTGAVPALAAAAAGRSAALALSAAARRGDAEMELERSKCLSKFDRLCSAPGRAARGGRFQEHWSFRPSRRISNVETSQPFATDFTELQRSPSPRQHPLDVASAQFLGESPEMLGASERHQDARRTWQLEMEMAKISLAAGRIAAVSTLQSTRRAATPGASKPRTPRVGSAPSKTSPAKAAAALEMSPRASSRPAVRKVQAPTKEAEAPVAIRVELKMPDQPSPRRILEEKASPQAAAQMVSMIDKLICREPQPREPRSQPESEGHLTPGEPRVSPRGAKEPEPESITSPVRYPRLLSCAAERAPSKPMHLEAKPEPAKPPARREAKPKPSAAGPRLKISDLRGDLRVR
ncbi:unnamed protein product [Effrenium voratum]|nr:unnamed protein product [Effrenium voratum]